MAAEKSGPGGFLMPQGTKKAVRLDDPKFMDHFCNAATSMNSPCLPVMPAMLAMPSMPAMPVMGMGVPSAAMGMAQMGMPGMMGMMNPQQMQMQAAQQFQAMQQMRCMQQVQCMQQMQQMQSMAMMQTQTAQGPQPMMAVTEEDSSDEDEAGDSVQASEQHAKSHLELQHEQHLESVRQIKAMQEQQEQIKKQEAAQEAARHQREQEQQWQQHQEEQQRLPAAFARPNVEEVAAAAREGAEDSEVNTLPAAFRRKASTSHNSVGRHGLDDPSLAPVASDVALDRVSNQQVAIQQELGRASKDLQQSREVITSVQAEAGSAKHSNSRENNSVRDKAGGTGALAAANVVDDKPAGGMGAKPAVTAAPVGPSAVAAAVARATAAAVQNRKVAAAAAAAAAEAAATTPMQPTTTFSADASETNAQDELCTTSQPVATVADFFRFDAKDRSPSPEHDPLRTGCPAPHGPSRYEPPKVVAPDDAYNPLYPEEPALVPKERAPVINIPSMWPESDRVLAARAVAEAAGRMAREMHCQQAQEAQQAHQAQSRDTGIRSRSQSRSPSRARLLRQRRVKSPSCRRSRSRTRSVSRGARRPRGGASPRMRRKDRSRSREPKKDKASKWEVDNVEKASVELERSNVPDWVSDLVAPASTAGAAQTGGKPWFKAITILASQVGYLIGPNGSCITAIRQASGCDIKIDHGRSKPFGTITITGNVEVAERMIYEKLATGPMSNAQWPAG